ncbi:MAG: hypothetical protein IJ422_01410 [Oscillospiraceae bacterium]|nr:hypothetical protein [Oscillospiraceae bacterium]
MKKMTAILLLFAMVLLPSCRESGIAGTTVPPDTTVPETTAPPQQRRRNLPLLKMRFVSGL